MTATVDEASIPLLTRQHPEDLLSQAVNNVSLLDQQRNVSHQDGTAPSLPPALAEMRGKSTTEILSSLNKSPLFMTDLEENEFQRAGK